MLKMDNCNNSKRGLARSAGASLPSVNAAAFSNPAAIALNRGLGIESIHYKNEMQIGVVTGTGRVGAAVANLPNNGTFFGQTAIETDNSYRVRRIDREKFQEDKLALAAGANLFGGKRKKGLKVDVGVQLRRHHTLEKEYGGAGATLSYNNIINIGLASYKDVYYEDLRDSEIIVVNQDGSTYEFSTDNNEQYIFKSPYNVQTLTAGLKFSKLAVDYIKFTTDFESETDDFAEASLYNISYFYRMWIFSYGRRFEKSYKEIYLDQEFVGKKHKSATFLGAQFATGNFLFGLFHNYYLLDEWSFGITFFL